MRIVKDGIHYLACMRCGKSVSTGYLPVKTNTPNGGIIVRAWIECPECIELPTDSEKNVIASMRKT